MIHRWAGVLPFNVKALLYLLTYRSRGKFGSFKPGASIKDKPTKSLDWYYLKY